MSHDPGQDNHEWIPILRDYWREPLRAQRDPFSSHSGRARSDRDKHRQWRKRSQLGRFIATYGWRAYAIPLLALLTVIVIYQAFTGIPSSPTNENHPVPLANINTSPTGIIGAPPSGLTEFDINLPTGILPDGGPYTEAGLMDFYVIPGQSEQFGQGTVKVFAYTIEVEEGIDPAVFGGDDAFATLVDQTLRNPKGWIHDPRIGFIRVDNSSNRTPDFRISLTSPMTIREGCGYEIHLESSCYNPDYGPDSQPRVFINEARWVRGAVAFQGDLISYRQYLINHEVGHAIGYHQHQPCQVQGGLAPIMMQQTFGTANNDVAKFDPGVIPPDGKVCRPNPWPAPIL